MQRTGATTSDQVGHYYREMIRLVRTTLRDDASIRKVVWDRCASNAEYHYLGRGKTFVRFGNALAEAMLTLEKK